MATVGISGKINVTKILKEHLFEGSKGKYLDVTMFVNLDENDQYDNNGMITQSWKDQQKGEGPILGNVKVFWRDDAQQAPRQQRVQKAAPEPDDFEDDIPFN